MKKIVFEATAFDDFTEWAVQDKKIYRKIIGLIKDIQRSSFAGLGKPEPLRHELQGYWSRRMIRNIGLFIRSRVTALLSPVNITIHSPDAYRQTLPSPPPIWGREAAHYGLTISHVTAVLSRTNK